MYVSLYSGRFVIIIIVVILLVWVYALGIAVGLLCDVYLLVLGIMFIMKKIG